MNEIAIVVPCYNEANRLDVGRFISFLKVSPSISFIFVNDGSSDDTHKLIDAIQVSSPQNVRSLTFSKNLGKSEAVRQGVLYAIESGAKVSGYWDADLSTPLECIERMTEKLQGKVELVIGSRVKLLGLHIERVPIRHYAGRLFATIASIVLGLAIYDTQCGAKIFKVSDEIQKAFIHPFIVNWTFDVELIGRLKMLKEYSCREPFYDCAVEYPLEKWIHKEGSKVGAMDFVVAMKEIIRLKIAFGSSTYTLKFR